MSFLSPHLLWFGLLGVPLVLLYLKRRRHVRIRVSSLMLWRRLAEEIHESLLMRRLKALLSLLLHLATLAAIVLALAQLFFAAAGLAESTKIVVLDLSASMGVQEEGRTRFDRAMDTLRELASRVAFGEKVMVIGAGRKPAPICPLTGNARQIRAALDAAAPTEAEGSLGDSIALAADLAAALRDSAVYVLSDGDSWAAPDRERVRARLAATEPRVPLYYRSFGREKENIGITAAAVRRNPISATDCEILVEITSHAGAAKKVDLSARLDSKILTTKAVEVQPGDSVAVTVPTILSREGVLTLSIEGQDAFPLDDSCAVALRPFRRVKTIVVSNRANFFLERAVATSTEIEAYAAKPGEEQKHADVDVVVYDGVLPQALPSAPGLVFLDPPGDVPDLDVRLTEAKLPVIRDWRRDHAVTSFVQFGRTFYLKGRTIHSRWGTSVLDCYRGSLIKAGEHGGRRVCLIGFDLLESNLPLSASMPVFIANLLTWAAGSDRSQCSACVATGDTFSLSRFAPARLPGSAQLVAADLRPVQTFPSAQGTFACLDREGVYSIRDQDRSVATFSANLLSRKETSIAPVATLGLDEAQIPTGLRGSLGRAARVPLTVAAVILLVLEAYLFHRRTVF